jgi:broad specificity phosphatase PhoE
VGKLLLVKHSLPTVTPDVPWEAWRLSPEGRRRCDWLAERLRDNSVTLLFSSIQPKAVETAGIVADALGAAVRVRQGLHENDRCGFGFVPEGELQQRFRAFFDDPARVCIGHESAQTAAHRFGLAVRAVQREAAGRTAAIIAHGTVITLFVAQHNRVSPFGFWQALSLPSYVCVDADTFACQEVRNFED